MATHTLEEMASGGMFLRPASSPDHDSRSAPAGNDVGTVNTRALSTARPLRSEAVDTRICEPERFTSNPKSVTKNTSDLVSAPFEPRSTYAPGGSNWGITNSPSRHVQSGPAPIR